MATWQTVWQKFVEILNLKEMRIFLAIILISLLAYIFFLFLKNVINYLRSSKDESLAKKFKVKSIKQAPEKISIFDSDTKKHLTSISEEEEKIEYEVTKTIQIGQDLDEGEKFVKLVLSYFWVERVIYILVITIEVVILYRF